MVPGGQSTAIIWLQMVVVNNFWLWPYAPLDPADHIAEALYNQIGAFPGALQGWTESNSAPGVVKPDSIPWLKILKQSLWSCEPASVGCSPALGVLKHVGAELLAGHVDDQHSQLHHHNFCLVQDGCTGGQVVGVVHDQASC